MRVFIADDHSIVRKGLRAVLEQEPQMRLVGEADNGRDAVRLCEQLQPEIAILDVAMPQLNGIDAASQILKSAPHTKVLILSMHSDESYVTRALSVGASGYLLKDTAETDLVPAIRAVSHSRPYFSPRVAAHLLQDYMRFLRQRGLEDSYQLLSDREREILQLLAEGRSNKEVAVLLGIGLSTVETHRTRLMQKLDLHSTADIVLYAVRKGIIT